MTFRRIWKPLLQTFSLVKQAQYARDRGDEREMLRLLDEAEAHAAVAAGTVAEEIGRIVRSQDDLARRRAATTPRIRAAAQGTPPVCGCAGVCAHRLA